MKCKYCEHEWIKRLLVGDPQKCPRCQKWIKPIKKCKTNVKVKQTPNNA